VAIENVLNIYFLILIADCISDKKNIYFVATTTAKFLPETSAVENQENSVYLKQKKKINERVSKIGVQQMLVHNRNYRHRFSY
jgi:hypothetical protein